MRTIISALAALCLCWQSAFAQTPPPVEAYGRLPAVSDAALSPDGSKIVLARFEDGSAQVRVIDIDRRSIVYAGQLGDRDRYRCATSIAGVSDLVEFLRVRSAQSGGADSSVSDYWRLSIGDREEDRERIRAASPAKLAERVTIPILLMHGADDTVAPIDQSRRMRSRLNAAGKDARFVELRGDDHYLSDEETRIQMLRDLESFLAQHLGP